MQLHGSCDQGETCTPLDAMPQAGRDSAKQRARRRATPGVRHLGEGFQEGQCFLLSHSPAVQVLFSTETFAMGVNAPARTVIFQSLR